MNIQSFTLRYVTKRQRDQNEGIDKQCNADKREFSSYSFKNEVKCSVNCRFRGKRLFYFLYFLLEFEKILTSCKKLRFFVA